VSRRTEPPDDAAADDEPHAPSSQLAAKAVTSFEILFIA
jgi:hypothetical protein